MTSANSVISVIVPAHNEARVIGRLLGRLTASVTSYELDVIVVANGCTDNTAEIAAGFGPPVRVITMATASKLQALAAGDRVAKGFPRVYVDADVETGAADLCTLADALLTPGVLAVGPEREFPMAECPWPVRRYYDVWTRLPEVRRGLFGRGVIAFSEKGHARITGLKQVIADDLAISLAFSSEERAVVPQARAVIHPPRTLTDLVRRRMRVTESGAQLDRTAGVPDSAVTRTRLPNLLAMIKQEPRVAPALVVFLSVAVAAKLGASRSVLGNDYSEWHRDESSRS